MKPKEEKFRNPYNFIPISGRPTEGPFADREPWPHSEMHEEGYSGTIEITLTAKTPLLNGEVEGKDGNEHHTHKLLRDENGAPLLRPTSIKGMLRSAYEAITNSRMGVFDNREKLKYRQDRRKLPYSLSPHDALNADLRPATEYENMSPADRVFGWVGQEQKQTHDNHVAYRGNLRIHNVQWTGEQEHIVTDHSLTLTNLGAPKPSQARFYASSNMEGAKFSSNDDVSVAFSESRGLRGRKVYPHHRKFADLKSTPQAEHEALRFGGVKDSQNRTYEEWLDVGASFSFRIAFKNLSLEELGALLWLLDLGEGRYHRMGAGKPLGFGSVALATTSIAIAGKKGWTDFFSNLDATDAPDEDGLKDKAIEAFKAASGGNEFEKQTHIAAFLKACEGYDDDLPIHYPRKSPNRKLDGDNNYEWFGENEKKGRGRIGLRLALPHILDGKGLPYEPSKDNDPRPSGGGGHQRGRS